MTLPRIVVPGATFALCRRTTLRKAFLGDWHPAVSDIFHYALADAQRQTGVEVHSAVRVVTHNHTAVTLTEPNLGDFLRRFNADVSCGINTLLAHERYDAPRAVYDKRQTHAMRLLDAPAQMSQAVYEHLNPVAAGLVEEARHMPGQHLDYRLWKAGSLTVRRPNVYFDESRPAELELRVTPPPLLLDAFDGDLDALVYQLERLSKEGTTAIRRARKRPAMGAQRLRRLHPWSEPKTMAEPGGRCIPCFKVGAAGLGGRRERCKVALERRAWNMANRTAWRAYRGGDRGVAFPHGTYQMRRLHGVCVDPPSPEAILAQPGPVLHDVLRECDMRRQRREPEPHTDSHAITGDVRQAWRHEVEEVVQRDLVDFTERSQNASSLGATPDTQRSDVEVRHRFAKGVTEDPNARRVVTLRDRRRTRTKPPPAR